MRQLTLRILTIACAIYLSGTHWLILQGTAWTKMLVERSQTMGISQAVKTTFDGEHPCAMCNSVSKGVKQESQQTGVLPKGAKLFEAMLLAPKVAALPMPVSTTFAYPFAPHLPALARADAPPTPPPLA